MAIGRGRQLGIVTSEQMTDLLSTVFVRTLLARNGSSLCIKGVLVHALGVDAVPAAESPVDDLCFNRFYAAI
jgi:hypothetical protein